MDTVFDIVFEYVYIINMGLVILLCITNIILLQVKVLKETDIKLK